MRKATKRKFTPELKAKVPIEALKEKAPCRVVLSKIR